MSVSADIVAVGGATEDTRAGGQLAEAAGAPTTSPSKGRSIRRQAAARERMRQALEMRKAGVTYQQIADQLGYQHRQGAHKAVRAALKDITSEPAREVRELELARLDAALLAIWPQVKQGSLGAIDRFVKLQHQRAQLLGLYAPQKIAPTDPSGENEWSGKSDAELIAEFERIIEAARARAGAAAGAGD